MSIVFEYREGDPEADNCLQWIESFSKKGGVKLSPLSGTSVRPKISRMNGEVIIGYNRIMKYLRFRFPKK